jgi:hypothetical protein
MLRLPQEGGPIGIRRDWASSMTTFFILQGDTIKWHERLLREAKRLAMTEIRREK